MGFYRGHRPFFRPMSTVLFVIWLIFSKLLALVRVHQPFPRPMSTVLFCYLVDFQLVVCLGACPSALSPPDVHGAVYYVVDVQ